MASERKERKEKTDILKKKTLHCPMEKKSKPTTAPNDSAADWEFKVQKKPKPGRGREITTYCRTPRMRPKGLKKSKKKRTPGTPVRCRIDSGGGVGKLEKQMRNPW